MIVFPHSTAAVRAPGVRFPSVTTSGIAIEEGIGHLSAQRDHSRDEMNCYSDSVLRTIVAMYQWVGA
jgi:hypothetical protein